MVQNAHINKFQAIEIHGAILPSSILEDIAKLHRSKELYLEASDYGIKKEGRLRDHIDSAWINFKKLWEHYQIQKKQSISNARVDFSKNLLQEVFLWNDIKKTSGLNIGDSYYPITHRSFDDNLPLILGGFDPSELDQGSYKFGNETRKRSPHCCLQECLNADDNSDWGILICGEEIRLLHDNPSLVKPSFLSIDLELLANSSLIDEFSIIWLILHSSRFIKTQKGFCIISKWKERGEELGERVRGALRNGVQNALMILGDGFLNHPQNNSLRNALFNSNTLSNKEFHEQLLRLIYRFLFLFTIEDRNLLFTKILDKNNIKRKIYDKGYSVNRLRELAVKRSTYSDNYDDLWHLQKLVFNQLNIVNSPLGLPGLGGIFSKEQCRDLENCKISNRALLSAIREIGWFRSNQSGILTRVRYKDMNTEEFGSIYEGLLELHPEINIKGNTCSLIYGDISGTERKKSGSYYTPDALVKEIIKSTLLPVINDRLSKEKDFLSKERELLNIKVIDPSCGSGHFLLAAARQLAFVLAYTRANNDQPSEIERQHALRDVVANCIYGVDKNPMAIELCKVALWIEAIEPGKPLSFLDSHIQCGDSLVGVFDSSQLENGIPDICYKPSKADHPIVCKSLKKENELFRKSWYNSGSYRGLQISLDLSGEKREYTKNKLTNIEAMPDNALDDLNLKQKAYSTWLKERQKDPQFLAADLFIAAFFLQKTSESRETIPTTEHLVKVINGELINDAILEKISETAKNIGFFHWYLNFSEVMARGGFDCVLGNPPWENLQLDPREFFSSRLIEIANAPNMAERDKYITNLQKNESPLYSEYITQKRVIESTRLYINGSNRYPLTSFGRINLSSLFAELSLNIIKKNSRAGLVLPSGIVTDSPTQYFCRSIFEKNRVVSIFDFENRKGLFSNVDKRLKFLLLTLCDKSKEADFVFFTDSINQLADKRRHFKLTPQDTSLLNPNTKTCPVFRSKKDAELTLSIYKRIPVLINEEIGSDGNPWKINFQAMFMMNSDSHFFKTREDLIEIGAKSQGPNWFLPNGEKYIRLYEGKMFGLANHRSADVIKSVKAIKRQNQPSYLTEKELENPNRMAISYYWVPESEVRKRSPFINNGWMIGVSKVTSPTNFRTFISSILPEVGAGDSTLIINSEFAYLNQGYSAALIGCLNSICFDYIARQKIGGLNMNFYLQKQLPVIPPSAFTKEDLQFISKRIKIIYCNSIDMKSFSKSIDGVENIIPFNKVDIDIARAELDAYYAYLYGLNLHELKYILDPHEVMEGDYPSETFRVLKNNEMREFGEYKTQKLILNAWNNLFG